MTVSFKIFSQGMKSDQRLGMGACTWLVKKPSSWPLAVKTGKKMAPGSSLVCLAKFAQAAKAFTKESTLPFSTLLLWQPGAGFSSDILGIGGGLP